MSSRRPSTKATAVTVLVVVLLAVALWTRVLAPRADEARRIREDAAQTEAAAAQVRDRLAVAAATEADPAALDARVVAARTAIPESADLDGLIRANAEAAAAEGVSLLSVNPGAGDPATAVPGTSAVFLEVQVRGDSANVRRYLARLEALPRLVVIDRLSSAVDGGGQLSANLSLRGFHTGTGEAAAINAAPAPVPTPAPTSVP